MNGTSRWAVLVSAVVLSPVAANVACGNGLSDVLKRTNEVLQGVKKMQGGESAADASPPPGVSKDSAAPGDAAKDSATPGSAARAATTPSKGVGPDIIGLRIGISPDEARGIIKSRPRQPSYIETPQTLAYKRSAALPQAIKGTDYLAFITTWGRIPDTRFHKIAVSFSPVPSREGLTWAYRKEEFDPAKRPTVEAFMKTLTEKYGQPTRWDLQTLPNMPVWSFDQHPALRPAGALKDVTPCLNYIHTDNLSDPQAASVTPAIAQNCGSIVLSVFFDFDGVNYTGPQTLVTGYASQLTGLSAIVEGQKAAEAIVDAARKKDGDAAIKAGQNQRPDL